MSKSRFSRETLDNTLRMLLPGATRYLNIDESVNDGSHWLVRLSRPDSSFEVALELPVVEGYSTLRPEPISITMTMIGKYYQLMFNNIHEVDRQLNIYCELMDFASKENKSV